MKFYQVCFFLAFFSVASITETPAALAQKHYEFTDEPIDVVIPCGENDLSTLDLCISGIRNNCSQVRRIIVVSSKPFTNQAEWFDEKNYPFGKNDIALELFSDDSLSSIFLNNSKSRLGWYYQQLLKLYAPFTIPDISSNVLILDADTIFLKPVIFLDETFAGLYNAGGGGGCGTQYHRPYFEHANRLLPGLEKIFSQYSGISHHMLFQRPVLEDLFQEIEKLHQIKPWQAFCRCVDLRDMNGSGASEYEIYFNYVFGSTDQVSIRQLHWAEISSLDQIPRYYSDGYAYVTCHHHHRTSNTFSLEKIFSGVNDLQSETIPTFTSADPVKIAEDLKRCFGDLRKFRILEIGSKNKDQYKILQDLGGVGSYTILDLPGSNKMTKQYLQEQGVDGVNFIDFPDLNCDHNGYDLVISNFSFSEYDRYVQRDYLEKIISQIPMGYIVGKIKTQTGSMKWEELAKFFIEKKKYGSIEPENPYFSSKSKILQWKPENSNLHPPLDHQTSEKTVGITYSLSGGRLGDNLLAYLHAKWIAYKYNLPLIYIPFRFSDQFVLDDEGMTREFPFKKIVNIAKESDINLNEDFTLYRIPYFSECKDEFQINPQWNQLYFQVQWDDPIFQKEIRKSLSLKIPHATPSSLSNEMIIGIHIRTGIGVDTGNPQRGYPYKFPPLHYYTEQLQKISKIFENQQLSIHILTDDPNPASLAKFLETELDNPNMHFTYRAKDNFHNENVIEDFLKLTQFNCLIRSDSNFSLVASKLGNYKILITPSHHKWNEEGLVIDEVSIFFNGNAP